MRELLSYKKYLYSGIDLLFPPICLCCEKRVSEQGSLCGECWSDIRFIERPYCEVLGTPFDVQLESTGMIDLQSAEAIANPPSFMRARAVARYDVHIRKLVSRLKFMDQSELAPWMANWMIRSGRELLNDKPIIIPVPLHSKRQFFRRYNQAAELARYIAHAEKLLFEPTLLRRIKSTRQQVGLGKKQRQKNMVGAFKVLEAQKCELRDKHVLLIDDVFTTGATLEAASRALIRAGAKQVDCLTFARVVRDT
jgi:ComF family protein